MGQLSVLVTSLATNLRFHGTTFRKSIPGRQRRAMYVYTVLSVRAGSRSATAATAETANPK